MQDPLSTSRAAWTPKYEADFQAVRAEVEEIVASKHFRDSSRYPSLLRYVVERTLQGHTDDLKERSIGAEVFHRLPDYDTMEDPVVRVCASEVRRRLALYYRENPDRGLQVELPLGRYTPLFRRVAAAPAGRGEDAAQPTAQVLEQPGTQSEYSTAAIHVATATPEKPPIFRFWHLAGAIGALALLVATGLYWLRVHTAPSPQLEVWVPLLQSQDKVLISVGGWYPEDHQEKPSPTTSILDRIRMPDFRISIPSAAAISQIAGLLEAHKKQFRVQESNSDTLEDFHRRPVVLVNAGDNPWTMLLLKPLRFNFVTDGLTVYIQDADHPEMKNWRIDNRMPYFQPRSDYAIAARFKSPSTEGPVVVVAGLSSNGTEAAGEFLVSPEALADLERQAHNSLDKNFEAVLKVEVLGGKTGKVTVVASQFW